MDKFVLPMHIGHRFKPWHHMMVVATSTLTPLTELSLHSF